VKALVLHGKDGNYRYESDWKKPSKTDKRAVIKVAYCGICGSDIPRFKSEGSYQHPVILGHEFSGMVSEVASNDSKFKVGDAVAISPIIACENCVDCRKAGPFHCTNYQFLGSRIDGGFAEYCAVPETNLIKLESAEMLKVGSLVEPMAVGLHAVRRSGFTPGKKALVLGAGPIGIIIGLWLREFGAEKVYIADIRERNIEVVRNMGFEVMNLSKTKITHIEKVTYAFEAAGSAKAIEDAINALETRGIFTVVGRDEKNTVIECKTFEMLMRKEISLLGCWGYDLNGEEGLITKTLLKYKRELESLISHTIPIEESESMVNRLCLAELEYCKIVLSL